MRIRMIFAALAVLAVAAMAGRPTVAAADPPPPPAASCSPSAAGGIKAPQLDSGTGTSQGIEGSATGGYSCTSAWNTETSPEFESSGLWLLGQMPNSFPFLFELPADYPPNPYAAGSGHNWIPQDTGGLYLNGPLGPQSPACAWNWRYHVSLLNADNGDATIVSHNSPELTKTC